MELFATLSECSVALTGFGAILAALRGADNPRGVFRAWTVVFHAAAALVLAIVPIVLASGGLAEEVLWRAVSLIGLVVVVVVLASQVWIDWRLHRAGHPPQSLAMIRSAQVGLALGIVALMANLLLADGPYLHAIAVFLLMLAALTALLHSFLVPLQLTMREVERERGRS